jgi:hypothetical protein
MIPVKWGVSAAVSGECLQLFVQFAMGSVCSCLCSLPRGVSAAVCAVCHGECMQLFVQFAILLGPTQVSVRPSVTIKSMQPSEGNPRATGWPVSCNWRYSVT